MIKDGREKWGEKKRQEKSRIQLKEGKGRGKQGSKQKWKKGKKEERG